MGTKKMTAKGEWWKVPDRSLGLGSQPYVLLFSGSFIRGSHVCIIPVFLNIPATGSSICELFLFL
jgi:hypothetical protein